MESEIHLSHNRDVKTLLKIFLVLLFAFSVVLVMYILRLPKQVETWSTLAGLLAVITAVIGAFPALRVLEIQEDAMRPRPTPFFDLTSRYNLLQLRVKNLGGGVAYDVQLKWTDRPEDYEGNPITTLDRIAVLLPQDSVSILVGGSSQVVRSIADTRFEGECFFKDSKGKKYREKFVCSVDANRKRLVHDDELPKTMHDLQDIPKQLARIAEYLEPLTKQIGDE